jgi:predicted ATPase
VARCGDPKAGIATCESGLARLKEIGGKCWLTLFLALLAECYSEAGYLDRSAAALAEALETVEVTNERIWEAEIHRQKGKLLLYEGRADAAAVSFTTAASKAKAQQAKLLELRAVVSLTELLIEQRRTGKARDLLMSAYRSFTEGFNFVDLREAKVLLDVMKD